MQRVLNRLAVFIHGDRLHKLRVVDIIYRERMEREAGFGQIEIPDPPVKRTGEYRETRNVTDPSPNAPLLKRVVQNPFVLERGYFTKASVPRCRIEPRNKIVFPKIVQEQLKKTNKIRTIRPMELHVRPEVLMIPTIDSWLSSSKQNVES